TSSCSLSMLCVQPASIPASMAGAIGTRPTARVFKVSVVLPSFLVSVAVVSPSSRCLPSPSMAMFVDTRRCGGNASRDTPFTRVVVAVRPVHDDSQAAAHADLELWHRAGEAARTEPLRQHLRIGPGLPH